MHITDVGEGGKGMLWMVIEIAQPMGRIIVYYMN